MKKLKSIFFVAGVMLLILSAVMAYLSIEELSAMLPADSYTDRGVYTFAPYEVASEQVKNTSASSRERRMNPTKTVYIICYRDIGGNGYRWKERTVTPEMGQAVVDAGTTVERRVLSIPDRGTYITVEPHENAESFTAGLRQRYIITLSLSIGYLLLYLLVWCIIWRRNRKEGLD
ncbi:hypothetical protein D1157_11535 [Anaerotruncus sp. X29]|jgi:hypothetical protein|nr:hypothetical protein [Anaerotruncus sp. X29]